MSSFNKFRINKIEKINNVYYLSGKALGEIPIEKCKLLKSLILPEISNYAYIYNMHYELKSWCILDNPSGLIELIVKEINVFSNISQERLEDNKRVDEIVNVLNALLPIPELSSASATITTAIASITASKAVSLDLKTKLDTTFK